jgi:hypothetical protein
MSPRDTVVGGRWGARLRLVGPTLAGTLAIGALLAPVASAASQQYGGADATLNTRGEVAALYKDASAKRSFAGLAGLSPAERDYFIANALTPTKVEPGIVDDTGAPVANQARKRGKPTARTAATYSWSVTAYCRFTNAIGTELWRYNSHWWWTGGGVRVFTADHNEYPSNLAWFWSYDWSHYLWPSGGLYTSYIGRATQGKFRVSIGVGGFPAGRTMYPVQDVHVHGDGHVWHDCSGA